MDDAVLEGGEAHETQKMQYLNSKELQAEFQRVVFDLLLKKRASGRRRPMKTKLEATLVGVAGEYLVAGELSLRGHLASITLRNSRGIDIIASNSDASRSVSIQVKTNSDGKPSWILSRKAEAFHSESHFYVFVALAPAGERARFHVVPSRIVAESVAESHRSWLTGVKPDGGARKDTSMRKFDDPDHRWLEAWDRLPL